MAAWNFARPVVFHATGSIFKCMWKECWARKWIPVSTHPSTFDVLDNGDFYAAYYGGDGEYAWNTAVYGTRRLKGETTWSRACCHCQQPVSIHGQSRALAGAGRGGLAFLRGSVLSTWSSSRIMAKISRDRCESWSDAFPITFEEGTTHSRPIVLQNGGYLLPIYHETGRDTEKTGADTSSLFLRLAPGSRSWRLPTRSIQGWAIFNRPWFLSETIVTWLFVVVGVTMNQATMVM